MIGTAQKAAQRLCFLTLLCLSFRLSLCAEDRKPASALELRIKPMEMLAGLPESVQISLVNTGTHDIRLPEPVKACDNSYAGSLYLRQKYSGTGNKTGLGTSCVEDSLSGPGILIRVKEWLVLHPGESYSVIQNRSELFISQNDPGKYELWVAYIPPFVSEKDHKALVEAGIDFPHRQLTSEHLRYTRKP